MAGLLKTLAILVAVVLHRQSLEAEIPRVRHRLRTTRSLVLAAGAVPVYIFS